MYRLKVDMFYETAIFNTKKQELVYAVTVVGITPLEAMKSMREHMDLMILGYQKAEAQRKSAEEAKKDNTGDVPTGT